MENDLTELHNLANLTFQNVTNLTPALRQMVANAKVYQKSVQSTCNLAVVFIENLQNVANAAAVSEGSTKKLGEVLVDIIDAFKEIENMKLELTKLFINEVIIPLESRAEIEIGNMKVTHKSYNSENKIQTELVDKAKANVSKIHKKSLRKKRSPKLDEKEKSYVQTLEEAEKKLKQVREEGLRKSLIEERRMYCFVAERMCAYGRGMIIYNNRISNFVNQKLPDWQVFISKPTELPPESEDIISNPSGYKMGTVRRKISKTEKKESIKRGKSFHSHFPTKYSAFDGRSSRGGSKPSLSAVTVSSTSNLSDRSGSCSPISKAPVSPGLQSYNGTNFPTPPMSVTDLSTSGSSAVESTAKWEAPTAPDGAVLVSCNPTRSEYANVVSLNCNEELSATGRSHSFTVPKRELTERKISLNRTESSAAEIKKRNLSSSSNENGDGSNDFASKIAMIQNQLSQTLDSQPDPTSKSRLKALYDHVAQDASQLDFMKDDILIPICEATAGWQYGEHEKSKKSGWFPAAFTEEVLVSSSGETQANHTGPSRRQTNAAPPPVAKKTVRAGRKISVAGTALSKNYSHKKHDTRRNSVGDMPHIPTSSSMPQMIHMLEENKTVNGHERKHSNSFQGLELLHHDDSFDDDSHDEEFSSSNPTSADSSPKKRKRGRGGYNAMPPPPPPPPPPEEEEEDIIQINNDKSSDANEIQDTPFAGISFRATAGMR